MPSKQKENKLSRNQKRLLIAGCISCVLLLLVLALVVTNITRPKPNKPASNNNETSNFSQTDKLYNEKTFKEVFVSSCVIQAKTTLSEAAANEYCNCTLDRGIEIYGTEQFIEINQRVAETYDLSKLKPIIDECLAKTINEQQG